MRRIENEYRRMLPLISHQYMTVNQDIDVTNFPGLRVLPDLEIIANSSDVEVATVEVTQDKRLRLFSHAAGECTVNLLIQSQQGPANLSFEVTVRD